MIPCIPDSLLTRLVSGGLEPDELGELNEHIDVCAPCRELVAALVRDPASTTVRLPEVSLPPGFAAPVFVGNARYDVLRLLGAGGMGEVYEAYDHQRDEVVALKTLPQLRDDGLLGLKDEFRVLADVRHPNLVRLYDLVQTDGHCFFTMERVAGLPLDQALAPLPVHDTERLRAIFIQLVEAVQELHRHGVLHRDLKPANVLVTATGRVVVLDFGLAVPWRPGATDSLSIPIAGTATYMAPEQVRQEVLAPSTDWYAVGGCLYRCLSGRAPFVGGSAMELMLKKQDDPEPPPITHRDEALAELSLRLLAPEPSVRPSAHIILRLLGAAPSSALTEPTVVGRESELGALRASIEMRRARLVVGPPGVGKSALTREAMRRELRDGTSDLHLTSRCRPQEHVPFNALDGIVDGIARYLRDDEACPLPPRASVAAVAAVFPSLRPFGPDRDALSASVSPTWLRRRAFEELRTLLGELARERRVLLCIDDLQWADPDSVELLEYLLDADTAPPWSLIATARTDTNGETLVPDPLALRFEQLDLSPLSTEASRSLLEQLGVTEAAEALLLAAEGQPLWLQRLAHAGGMHGGTLEELLSEQVQSQCEPARRLLDLVALAGTPLRLDVLADAAGMSLGVARRHAETLQAELLLRLEPPAAVPRVEPYHDRVREVSGLSEGERRAPRLVLARALAKQIQHRGELFACADHANAAFEIADEGDKVVFAEINLRAARQARDATAYARCATYAEQGLRWLDAAAVTRTDERRAALELLQIEALYFEGRRGEALDVFERAARGRPPLDQLELWLRRVQLELVVGDAPRALDAGREALDRLGAPFQYPVSSMRVARTLLTTEVRARRGWRRLLRDEPTCPPRAAAEMRLLAALAPVGVFLADIRLMMLLSLRCHELTLRHGLAPQSVLGIAGHGGAAAVTRRYARASEALVLARETERRFGRVPAIANMAVAGWAAPWGEPLLDTERYLRAAEVDFEARGDAYSCSMIRGLRLVAAWQRGAPVPELQEVAQGALRHIEKADLQFDPLASILALSQATLDRIRRGADLPACATYSNPFATFYTHLHEALVRHHWGEVAPGLRAIRQARRHRFAVLGQSPTSQLYSYLVLLACQASEQGLETDPRLALEAAHALVELRAMARACPENHACKWHLATAEAHRWRGARVALVQRAYQRAIHSAVRSENLEFEGIARQRQLSHLRRNGRSTPPSDVRRMHQAFAAWGCAGRGRELVDALEGPSA